jgi:peptidoglycan/xylan/chitin deacetylase (PgdA/CDA1 family)
LLALTFDDGPDPRGTSAMLDALAAANVKATFFVLGERVERNLALLARVLEEGHEVELHGYEHRAILRPVAGRSKRI